MSAARLQELGEVKLMPAYPFVTVDVFTDQRFGGNPLAVFPDARGLTDAQMQSLAHEFNLSETTFVLPPEDPAHSARVRIFTTTYEMPFAGHPNVGTGFVLAEMGRDRDGALFFEEIAGLVEVHITRDQAGAVTGAEIAAPQPLSLGQPLPAGLIAACVGLQPDDIVRTTHEPVTASVGNPFVLAEVKADALTRASPDLAAFRQAETRFPEMRGRFALYLYVNETPVRTRMFAPLSGTWEDPATGSAATPLAALLLSHRGASSLEIDILQGVEMGRPSLLRTSARKTADGIRASVSGSCVHVLRGEATV